MQFRLESRHFSFGIGQKFHLGDDGLCSRSCSVVGSGRREALGELSPVFRSTAPWRSAVHDWLAIALAAKATWLHWKTTPH